MASQNVITCHNLAENLTKILSEHQADRIFLLTDTNTHLHCSPILHKAIPTTPVCEITIGSGEANKTLENLSRVWRFLSEQKATRHSLLLNLGGGMITDLGGFAAATFKRGIRYINIPTTLLAMVDASVGGKTGIDFNGLKNEIGSFFPATDVLIDTQFLKTLDLPNILSGYAEMLKHGLIANPDHWAELLTQEPEHLNHPNFALQVEQSIKIKESFVCQDPQEQGIRKALNFGHTAGHAFESLALNNGKPVLHGYAVAWGIVCELYLSHILTGFPIGELRQTVQFIRSYYGSWHFDCNDYENLYQLMLHDKKNQGQEVNFTLLKQIGSVCINQTIPKETIFEMLDFFRECMN